MMILSYFRTANYLKRLFLIVTGSILLSACINDVADQTVEPFVVINPQGGGVHTEVVVSGENFPADTAVMLRLGPPDVGATPFSYGSTLVDTNGRFTLSFTMPDRWPDDTLIAETELTVIAINEDGSLKATAPFAYQPDVSFDPALKIGEGELDSDSLLLANEQAIVEAVKNYLIVTGESSEVAIVVEQIEDEFARVNIYPLFPDSEGNATGFLKSIGSVWEVLIIGRNLDIEQLLELGIPHFILLDESIEPAG